MTTTVVERAAVERAATVAVMAAMAATSIQIRVPVVPTRRDCQASMTTTMGSPTRGDRILIPTIVLEFRVRAVCRCSRHRRVAVVRNRE
jgi:hypothetical protein